MYINLLIHETDKCMYHAQSFGFYDHEQEHPSGKGSRQFTYLLNSGNRQYICDSIQSVTTKMTCELSNGILKSLQASCS